MYHEYHLVGQTNISANVYYIPIHQIYCLSNILHIWYVLILYDRATFPTKSFWQGVEALPGIDQSHSPYFFSCGIELSNTAIVKCYHYSETLMIHDYEYHHNSFNFSDNICVI